MKTKIKILALSLILWALASISPVKTFAQGGPVSYQVFYDDLSPYGNWVDYPNYGYVWVPDVAPGFTPYATNGYWVLTDDGWTWVSNYSWGWAPFHYGRWYTDANYGPVWIPGNEWGPGWVTWRQSNNYYGWAPMGPGITFEMAYGNGYNEYYNPWTFVGCDHFGTPEINNYYVTNITNNTTIYNNTTVVNNVRNDQVRHTKYNAGPNVADVEKRGGKTFTPVSIKENNKPGQSVGNNQMLTYRPVVQKNNPNGQKAIPTKVSGMKDVQTIQQRKTGVSSQKQDQLNKQQPVKTQPNNIQNKQQPVKTQPDNSQNKQQPIRTQPNKQQPVRTQPTKQQPTQQQNNPQPTQQQTKPQPTQQKPMQQQNKPQPTQQQTKQEPTQQQNKQQPTQSQPQHDNKPKK